MQHVEETSGQWPAAPAKRPTEAELVAARRTVENEDYLPWAMVADAKALLGIVEPSYLAEVLQQMALESANA